VGPLGQRLVLVEGEEPAGGALLGAHVGDQGVETVALLVGGEGGGVVPPAQGEGVVRSAVGNVARLKIGCVNLDPRLSV
jgi:hypothetical protein